MNAEEWVRAATRRRPVPFLPELQLHLGEDIVTLWERTEDWAGRPCPDPPFWAFAWAGGLGLARHLLDNPGSVRGRRVLDLATGCGVVAVAAAQAGAERVIINDVDPLAVTAARLNAAVNGVRVQALTGDLLTSGGGRRRVVDPLDLVDVVLAGDVFYDRELAQDVLPFLQRAAERGCRVLVGDPGRRYLPRPLFLPMTRYDVPVPRDLEGIDVATVTVWWLPARTDGDA